MGCLKLGPGFFPSLSPCCTRADYSELLMAPELSWKGGLIPSIQVFFWLRLKYVSWCKDCSSESRMWNLTSINWFSSFFPNQITRTHFWLCWLRWSLFLWHLWLFLQGSLSLLLGVETPLCKTCHFQWIYGKLNQIYEKLTDSFKVPQTQPNLRAYRRPKCQLTTKHIANQMEWWSIGDCQNAWTGSLWTIIMN